MKNKKNEMNYKKFTWSYTTAGLTMGGGNHDCVFNSLGCLKCY